MTLKKRKNLLVNKIKNNKKRKLKRKKKLLKKGKVQTEENREKMLTWKNIKKKIR